MYVKKISETVDEYYKQLLEATKSATIEATLSTSADSLITNDQTFENVATYRGMYRRSDLIIYNIERLFIAPR